MKKTFCLFFAYWLAVFILGCNEKLNEIADDFYQQAPKFCKESCQGQFDCLKSLKQDITGDYADDALESGERMCVFECAIPCAEGVYVVSREKKQTEYEDYVNGSAYEDFAKCVWTITKKYYDCTEKDQWDYDRNELNEDDCDYLEKCYESLNIGWTCSWERNSDTGKDFCYCDSNGKWLSPYAG